MPPLPRLAKRGDTSKLKEMDWTGFRLRLPQIRVLKVLAGSEEDDSPMLNRAKLSERAGFSPISGTINSCLRGVPHGSSSGPARPGLLTLGYVQTFELDINGIPELVYQITEKGKEALEAVLSEVKIPKMRDKVMSTNSRYKK